MSDNSSPKRLSPKEISDEAVRILTEQGEEAFNRFLQEQQSLPGASPALSKREFWKKLAEDARKAGANTGKEESDPSKPEASGFGDKNEGLSDDIQKVIAKSPVDHSVAPVFKPGSIRDAVSILQPKSVVFAKYSLTEWQEDIITLIMEQLQGYLSTSLTTLRQDVLGEITLRIDCSEIAGDDKNRFLEHVNKLMTYPFEFWWQSESMPEGAKKIETKGMIISTYHNYVGTSYVDLVINRWAVPFLLFYGKGVGATKYLKRTALALPGKYSKRIYKILSGYIDKGGFDYPIDKLRKEFDIPDKYSNGEIKRTVINPAVEQINAFAEGFAVSADFVTKDPSKYASMRRKPFDTIRFVITKNEAAAENPGSGLTEEQMEYEVYSFLHPILGEPYRSRLHDICDTWKKHGDIRFAHSKIKYYEKQAQEGKMSPLKMKNFLIKALEEETKTELHLSKKRKLGA